MLYVGVDAHKTKTHVTVLDETGAVVRRKQITSSPVGVREVFGDLQEPMKAVLEASYCWGPMYDWLAEFAEDVVLAHPAKVRAIADARIKTDAIDSRMLAHLLPADLIPVAYAPSKETRVRKRVLRQRMFWVRVQTMLKNRIQTLLSQHIVVRPDVTDLFGKAGLAWLHQLTLPEPDGQLLRADLTVLALLAQQIAATDRQIAELAAGDPIVAWIASLPGIGPFLSVLIRHEVDEMSRFRTPKKFVSYTGLVPATYSSGNHVFHGRLTKQGNKWLRWGFIEAVAPAIRVSSSLRRYYDRIKTRRGAHDARVCTARKLAELVWAVWTQQRCYAHR